jgi:DNA repair protein RAD5
MVRYVFPPEPCDGIIDLTQEGQPFYFNPYSGELSLDFPKAERRCKGGILADEMGMGKTIMVSALIQTLHEPETIEESESPAGPSKGHQLRLNNTFRKVPLNANYPLKGPSATLIVAPTSLLAQWAEELQRSSKPATTKVLVWHGQNRRDLELAMKDDDDGDKTINVVVTSYGVLVSEHAKQEKSMGSLSLIFESKLFFADEQPVI